MADLRAEVIPIPPFELKYLRKGHAVHFRCHDPDAEGLRVDVMSRMRGVDPFEKLWSRRTTVELPDGTTFDLLSIPDLVQAKKTQPAGALCDALAGESGPAGIRSSDGRSELEPKAGADDALRAIVASGQVSPSAQVWRPGAAGWAPLTAFPELGAAPPPPPPPPSNK